MSSSLSRDIGGTYITRSVAIMKAIPTLSSQTQYANSPQDGHYPSRYAVHPLNDKPYPISHPPNGIFPTRGRPNSVRKLNGYINGTTPTLSPMPTTVIKHYCDCCDAPSWTTEFHGISEMLRSQTWQGRMLWCSIITAVTSLGIFFTYSVIADYTSTPTATRITLQPVAKLQFPKITVCPKNADALQWNDIREDFNRSLPMMSNISIDDLVGFVLAGSGFDNMDPLVNRWSSGYIDNLELVYNMWRGNRSIHAFFVDLMEGHGFRCDEMFPVGGCVLGERALNCCDIFKTTYVMRRGKCLSTYNLYQSDSDEIGKFALSIKQLNSRLVGTGGLQPQAVIYISDNYPSIPDFPRYYLNANEWNRMRFTAKNIQLIPRADLCSNESSARGRGTCFVNQWLQSNVIRPFNCTFPYMIDLAPSDVSVCHPADVVRNYKPAVISRYNLDTCMPACTRWDYSISILTSHTLAPFPDYTFRVEASYMDLQYEHFLEIKVGGQLGLFLGTSIITFAQITLFTCVSFYRMIYRLCKRRKQKKRIYDSNESQSDIGCDWGLY